MRKNIAFVALIIVVSSAIFLYLNKSSKQTVQISNFEQCVKAGNPVMESYPEQCRHNDQTFTQDIGNELEKQGLIMIVNPRPNQVISSPLEVVGTARGYWFFEASFPVVLYNEEGDEIASGIAEAQDEWMTEEFVPFKLTLSFTELTGEKGKLVLKKDNPSGLPENEDQLVVPVRFK